ncbi:nucleotide exchange factor GrpE [[Mycoplasma] collis]|uniref:nucleotide exchange factor GrpE n=1 Tax=[Mycoplasma] collis TaxID=2127 RepID=UPI000690F4A3|nr:nucleotide exchange factor GrpE [[Mycoplasma] collis]
MENFKKDDIEKKEHNLNEKSTNKKSFFQKRKNNNKDEKLNNKKNYENKENKENIENSKKDSNSETKDKKIDKKIDKKNSVIQKLKTELDLSNIKIQTLELEIERNINQFKTKVSEVEKKAKEEIQRQKDENFSKFELKSTELKKYGNQKFFEDFIMILKHFEMAIKSGEKQNNHEVNKYVQGFSMLYKQIENLFSNYGLTKIEPYIGEKFNPEMHQVIEKRKNSNFKEMVIEVKGFGYKLHDRVIKAADVVIGE